MVKANTSWIFPPHDTWRPPNFNFVATPIAPVQQGCLPAFVNSGTHADMMMPGIAAPNVSSSMMQHCNGDQGLPHSMPPRWQNFLPATDPCLKENLSVLSHGFAGHAALNAVPGCHRKFVIFDKSGNDTRLIYSSFFPNAVRPTMHAVKPSAGSYLHCEEHAAKIDPINLTVPKWHEVADENHLSSEESEMHEDTQEINALLYSDDDDYDDGNSDDDEVTSTDRSPTLILSCGTRRQVEELTKGIAYSDGENKRQKLLDGGFKRSPLADTVCSTKVAGVPGYDYDHAESSCNIGQSQEELRPPILGSNQLKKDKIRATLKILESLIPGAKDKDPLMVLDVAISHLKSLKLEAKTLGVNYS